MFKDYKTNAYRSELLKNVYYMDQAALRLERMIDNEADKMNIRVAKHFVKREIDSVKVCICLYKQSLQERDGA